MIPLRMALWQRDREGHPTVPTQQHDRNTRVPLVAEC